jgi:hypothetical protein
MTSKFEQLIEYVINDEEQKARELFHDIVVEKSREIYENLMQEEAEEEVEEAKDEELDEGEEELDEAKDEELDEAKDEEVEESMHGEMDETAMGGDSAEKFMDEVEVEEEGMMEEEGGEDLEDRVVDLEDKLDELMAEFEAMMGDKDDAEGDGDMGDADMGGDAIEMDDTEEFSDEGGEEESEEEFELAEGISLKAAPKPTTSEEGSVNKKGVVAANSGQAGMAGKPVHATGGEEKGRTAPTAKDVGVTPTQEAGSKAFKSAAPSPVKTQAPGTNARSPLPKG